MSLLPTSYVELEAIYARTLGAGVRTLAVTSSVSGEGVSTVAEALARRTGASGQTVLLVELNLFRPQLSQQLSALRHDWFLQGDTANLAVVKQGDFDFLSAPSSADAPMRFREHALLHAAIKHWLHQYDAVIFDTSPLNAVNQGNIPAELVCSACDGSLMVVMSGCTSESALREAGQRLRDAGSQVLGTVMNDCYHPTLASELIRETHRLDQWLPKLARRLRYFIRNSALINAPV